MDNALKAAIEAYATMSKMTEREVLEAINGGNESVRRSVTMLLFAAA
ncbi:hypothetical protein [Aquabacterium sp.]|nr:hypothetical protein [Aquabacterium sp.]